LSIILLLLPALLVVVPAIAAWIRVVGRGRILFRQDRVGYRGKIFTLYKFRSMKENAKTETHESYVKDLMAADRPMTKLDALGDTRLIPGGGFLRKSGLDELPQLINVLRGQMSVVGPRPCLREEYAEYTLPQRERFDTVPGLTGYWQVNGKNRTTFSEMVALDVQYVRNKSIWMDLGVIIKTPLVIISQMLERKSNPLECDPEASNAGQTGKVTSP
jgi:lipopolysaccharide/colanic/teichoic acid biosynthesis glycosyltransferase